MSVTLKDVAEKLGVTITTVHKALNGKEGVSEKRRAEIMKVAAQMGYKVNYMASSLSKKKFHIAVVLPNTDGDNRFYYGALWDGIRNYLDTVSEFPITVSEYAYPLTRDGNGLVLEKIFNQDSDDLQGLITIAMDHDRSSYFLEKFAKKQIPVVLIGVDLHTDFRLCCIKANDTAVGYLAAELLTAFLPSGYPAKILMAGDYGCLGMEDQRLNMQAFSAYLHTYAPSIETVPFQGSDPLAVSKEIRQYLTVHPDTYAIYTCSARFTYHISQCIRQLGIQDRIQVIGNDLFTESRQALSDGILRGVIDKKITVNEFSDKILEKMKEFYPDMTEYVLSEDELAKIQESYEKQFNTWDWTYGQSPEYTVERNVRYPAGKISTYANVENSIIKSVKIYGDFFGIGDVSDIEELLVGVPYEYEDVLAKLKTIDTTHYFSRMTTEEVAKAIVA